MDRRIDIAISAVFIAFGIFVILEAITIKSGMFTDPVGPRAFFYGCGAIFILGGLANIAQRVMTWQSFPGHLLPSEGVDDEPDHPSSFGRAALVAAISIVYVLTFRPLGYLLATPVYVFACLWVLKQRNWLIDAAVALTFTIVFYIIFARGLGVWLPVGPFTEKFREWGWIIL